MVEALADVVFVVTLSGFLLLCIVAGLTSFGSTVNASVLLRSLSVCRAACTIGSVFGEESLSSHQSLK